MADALAVILSSAGAMDELAALNTAGVALDALEEALEESRPKLLSLLKASGVASLTKRQAITNAVAKYVRTGSASGGAETSAATSDDPGPAPPGFITVSVRCSGALGGDNCPLNGKFRSTRVHTKAATIKELYDELQHNRGYALDFENVRVTANQAIIEPRDAAGKELHDDMHLMFLGPNRGG